MKYEFLILKMKFIVVLFKFFVLIVPYLSAQILDTSLLNEYNTAYDAALNFVFPNCFTDFQTTCTSYQDAGTFDFIIIGAGTAGCTLARRLTENSLWTVLLLEVGNVSDTPLTDMPLATPLHQLSTVNNFAYTSTKQNKSCLGMQDQKCNVPRGKGVGGSSLINFMLYVRGSAHDEDNWGFSSWRYNKCLPYYIKSENASLISPLDSSYHGSSGPLSIEEVRYASPSGQMVLDAAVELNRPILDYNGVSQMGYRHLQAYTKQGQRASASKSYVDPVRSRTNLNIRTGTLVTKIIIDNVTMTATGVEYTTSLGCYRAYATKEVISSAGSVGSPQLLMLSGIGPQDDLQNLGIPVIQNASVGKNLWDHPFFYLTLCTNYTETFNTLLGLTSYLTSGSGFFTAAGNVQSIGFINTNDASATYPNIEEIAVTLSTTDKALIGKILRYTPEIINDYLINGCGTDFSAGYFVNLLHEKSRGQITLKSTNPYDYPNIDLNIFDNPDDVETILSGVKDVLALLNTNALKKYNVRVPNNPIENCNSYFFMSDDYIRCAIRYLGSTLLHLGGTCKMGPSDDPTAVVDQNLKVYGVNNLRVVDGSIIPNTISGHLNSKIYMLAEKTADIIKNTCN